MNLEKRVVALGLAGALLMPSAAFADESAVIQLEAKIRKRGIFEFYQAHPEGINRYIFSYEPQVDNLFSIEGKLIGQDVIDSVKSNEFLAEDEKKTILGYSEKINVLLEESEQKEVSLYQRIANAVPPRTDSKEKYSETVKVVVQKSEFDALFAAQIKVYELALELFEFVRKTKAYQQHFTETQKLDLFHTINPEVSTDNQLIGYFKTKIELIKIQQRFWGRVYT